MRCRLTFRPKVKPSYFQYGVEVGRYALIWVAPGYLLVRWPGATWRYVSERCWRRLKVVAPFAISGWHRGQW